MRFLCLALLLLLGSRQAGGHDYYVLPIRAVEGRVVHFGERFAVLTRDGKPPKRTPGDDKMVRWNRERADRLRAELARATAATWVCMADTGEPSFDDHCGDDARLMERNPDYWDRSQPSRIQLLTVHTDDRQLRIESDQHYAVRAAVWDALDWNRLAGMVLP